MDFMHGGTKRPELIYTAYLNLKTGYLRMLPNSFVESGDKMTQTKDIDGYLGLLSVAEKDYDRVRASLSLESISRNLASSDVYTIRFGSNRQENSVGFSECQVSVCERDGGQPVCAVLLTRSTALIREMNRVDDSLSEARRMMDECFRGLGVICNNIILIDVGGDSYMWQKPIDDYSDERAVRQCKFYSQDIVRYAKHYVHPDDMELFLSYTSLDAYRNNLKTEGSYESFELRLLRSGEYRWVKSYTIRLGGDNAHFRVLYFYNDIQSDVEKRNLIEALAMPYDNVYAVNLSNSQA